MEIGFIGIGNMGWPMAANIARAGHSITVHDTNPGRCAQFIAEFGGSHARELAELGKCGFIVTMLPTGAIVTDVFTSAGGRGLLPHLSAGTIAIDMSSSEPRGTQALGPVLAARDVTLIDAPVSGGVPRAQSGTLTIMIGGNDAAVIERARPLLGCMGSRLFETGPLGSGHAMKALNNFVAAAGYAAAAEALLVGGRFGLDPGRMLDILNVSTGRSFSTEVVMKEHVLGERFATGFALGLLAKDVRIAAELARALHQDAPLAELMEARWALALQRLGAGADHSKAILGWDRPG